MMKKPDTGFWKYGDDMLYNFHLSIS